MGGIAEKNLTFRQRFVDETELALFEIADTAVDELGGLRRRPGREVVPLDESRAKAA